MGILAGGLGEVNKAVETSTSYAQNPKAAKPAPVHGESNKLRTTIGSASVPTGSYGAGTAERVQDSQARLRGDGAPATGTTIDLAPSGDPNYNTRAYQTGNVLSGPTYDGSVSTGGVDQSSGLPKDLSTLPDKVRQTAAGVFGSTPRPAGGTDAEDGNAAPSITDTSLPDTGGGAGTTGGSRGGNGSSGGGSAGGNGSSNGTGYADAELLAQALRAAGVSAEPYQLPTIDGPNPERIEHVDTTELRNLLQQIMDSQAQQGGAQIDRSVEQGVNELNRAMEDAALQYQAQRDQATADELRALDNQALYAEARGDRGGIGEAQYGSIQAAAAQNRRAVNDAQVKLGTDTARQIADLRSQGEFQKADQLLSLTQNYLSQLMSLEQWALEANLGVDEFNSRLQQWVDEYNLNVQQFLTDLDLSAAQLTGVFANGNQTAATRQRLNESLASSGSALLSAGILPSRQQLEAMGMTETQAKAYIRKMSE